MFRGLLRLACCAFLVLPSLAAAQARPPCSKVNSEVNRNVRARGGMPAGVAAVAKRLGTDQLWVERCMEVYGRVPAGGYRMNDFERERLEEALESGDPLFDDPEDIGEELEEGLLAEPNRRKLRPAEREMKRQDRYERKVNPFEGDNKYATELDPAK
jgi:hypothetical protein